MTIQMANAAAQMRMHESGFLQDFSTRDFEWLLIGAALAMVIMWGISRQRRRWF